MKIAILGATGFVGRNLVKYFSVHHEIFAFSRKEGERLLGVQYFYWDHHDLPPEIGSIDICIDCVSDIDYTKTESELEKNNVGILTNTMKFLRETECKHYIYISSASVYMDQEGILDEESLIYIRKLKNSYAKSKYLAEQYILENIPKNSMLSIVRPRAVYGQGDTTLLPKILESQICSYLILPGGGKVYTSLTHIDNLLSGIEIIIEKQVTKSEVYNIADGNPYQYSEVFTKMAHAFGLKGYISIPSFIVHFLTFISSNKWLYLEDIFTKQKQLDILKIKTLGYTPKSDIFSYLNETIQ